MKLIKGFIILIGGIKVLIWIAAITLIYVYSAEIGGLFTGALARLDHLIGFTT